MSERTMPKKLLSRGEPDPDNVNEFVVKLVVDAAIKFQYGDPSNV